MPRTHPRAGELLMASDGELSRQRQAVVNEHLSACFACRSRLHQIRTTLADVSGFYNSAFQPASRPLRSARRRLARALREAADDRNHSWCGSSEVEPAIRAEGSTQDSPAYGWHCPPGGDFHRVGDCGAAAGLVRGRRDARGGRIALPGLVFVRPRLLRATLQPPRSNQ